METLVPAPVCRHGRIRVATGQAIEFIDLTVRIEALVAEAGIHAGWSTSRASTRRQPLSSTNTSRCCWWTSANCWRGRLRRTHPIVTMIRMPGTSRCPRANARTVMHTARLSARLIRVAEFAEGRFQLGAGSACSSWNSMDRATVRFRSSSSASVFDDGALPGSLVFPPEQNREPAAAPAPVRCLLDDGFKSGESAPACPRGATLDARRRVSTAICQRHPPQEGTCRDTVSANIGLGGSHQS